MPSTAAVIHRAYGQRAALALLFLAPLTALWIEPRWARLALATPALLASFWLHRKLHAYTLKYYLSWVRVSLDPLGLDYYPEASVPAPAKRGDAPRVLFYGDSRSVAWPAPSVAPAVEFLNRGVSGQTTAQVLARFDLHVTPLGPDVVVIQVGINDLKALPFFPAEAEEIVGRCRENISELVARSLELGSSVILSTIFPPGPVPIERRAFWSRQVPGAVRELNAAIRSLGSDRVAILDSHSILSGGGNYVRAGYALDTLHIGPRGYRALNDALGPLLEQILGRANSALPRFVSKRDPARAGRMES